MKGFVCAACRAQLNIRAMLPNAARNVSTRRYTRPSFAPKPILDLKHMRENPGLYEQNSVARRHVKQSRNAWRILGLHETIGRQRNGLKALRQHVTSLEREITKLPTGDASRAALVAEAREAKNSLRAADDWERSTREEMERLAFNIPNLSSQHTPAGSEPTVIAWIGGEVPPQIQSSETAPSHVDIGKELDLIDLDAAATTSGWGWYFLKNEGALLEQALIQYALSVAVSRGWKVMTPPSLVYSHIANACGFMPRDRNGESQIYGLETVASSGEAETDEARARLVLAGTAEIPLAASQANKTLREADLPLKVIGVSRCYRREAGARGLDTRGLFRVHEFTKVEMFAWTAPGRRGTLPQRFDTDERSTQAQEEIQTEMVFDEMLSMQREILTALGLHARVLEMPDEDLGASASRKIDIEAFFPSRISINNGYGEVTSASVCTDYQTRRLATRLKDASGKLSWPHTLNGTALAVPRVLACLLENGWDANTRTVKVPGVLTKWMPGNSMVIGKKT